jgi:uncharacterized RDD family membrane protein YckC
MYCDQCGEETEPKAKFCQSCGAELTGASCKRAIKTEFLSEEISLNNATEKEDVSINKTQKGSIDQNNTFFGGTHHPWRRLFARSVDLFLGLIMAIPLFFLTGYLTGYFLPQYINEFREILENPYTAGVLIYLLWLPIEAIFLASIGTTPAKWVFGIRILNKSGDKLTYLNALKRAALVWVQGDGFGIPIISFFTRLIAYRRLNKTGTTLWDEDVGSIVTHKKWGSLRIISSTTIVLIALTGIGFLNSING